VETRKQGSTVFGAVLLLVGTLIVIQLWLVAAALDAVIGGESGVSFPAALGSAALFLGNAGLFWHVVRLDRRVRGAERK
jgi:hypothetical protein